MVLSERERGDVERSRSCDRGRGTEVGDIA